MAERLLVVVNCDELNILENNYNSEKLFYRIVIVFIKQSRDV